MLDESFKSQLKEIFAQLEANYELLAEVSPSHPSREELLELLKDTASCSDHIKYGEAEGKDLLLRILKDGKDTGVSFRAVPGGHEFSSLILALLNADGKGKNLPDEALKRRAEALKGPAEIRTYMSLSCTNCPDVVQALNVIALLNPNITHVAIDGALNEEEVERFHIQAVPTVFLGDKAIHVGRGEFGVLLEKLEEKLGSVSSAEASKQINHDYDAVVAGAGPAGAAAAIYLARKGLRVAVVAGRVGGQVNETVGIENLISVPHTTGKELAASLQKHMGDYSIDIYANRQITNFSVEDNGVKAIATKGNETFRSRAVIIATGASWRKLNVPGENDYIGKGVAFCPHCDGPFYKGKHVAVIGGGNSGVEAAIDLAGICSKVTVLEFMETLKADNVLQDKLRSLKNVEVFTNKQTLEVDGDGNKMTALRIKDRATNEETHLTLDGVFVQIGLSANSKPFSVLLETNRIGEIKTDKACRTSVPGVYAAGDVSDIAYKQIVIAMGEGAKAALSAFDDKIRGVL